MANITVVPAKGDPASTGNVSFDLKFDSLGQDAGPGHLSGLVRLNLVLGVDKDCDLATGDHPVGLPGQSLPRGALRHCRVRITLTA